MTLTRAQKNFIESLDGVNWTECFQTGKRTATALHQKGLVEIDSTGYANVFECRIARPILLEQCRSIDFDQLEDEDLRRILRVLEPE